MTSLYCVGDSHMRAVMRAAATLGIPVVAHSLKDPMHDGDTRTVAQRAADAIAAIQRDRPSRILCFVGGSAPATLGTFEHPRPFDFALPWRRDLPCDAGAEIVPYDAIRQLVENMSEESLRTLARMRRLGFPMIQFETPPPFFDGAVLLDLSRGLQRKLRERGNSALQRYAIAGPWLRYKMWALHSRVFADFCRSRDIAFAPNPPEALDENGFLAESCLQDLMHGNERYGTLVLEQVCRS